MHPWQLAALGAACFIAGHYLFLRAASGRIGDVVGALVLEVAAAVGVGIAYAIGIRGGTLAPTRAGIMFSALSGLSVSAASILIFYSLRRGGPVAVTGTMVLGGGVTLSALVSPWLFGEQLSPRRMLGVGLGIAALIVLSTESAETVP